MTRVERSGGVWEKTGEPQRKNPPIVYPIVLRGAEEVDHVGDLIR